MTARRKYRCGLHRGRLTRVGFVYGSLGGFSSRALLGGSQWLQYVLVVFGGDVTFRLERSKLKIYGEGLRLGLSDYSRLDRRGQEQNEREGYDCERS